jgi:hypothetical protein
VSFYTFLLKRRLANYGISFIYENLSSLRSNIVSNAVSEGTNFFSQRQKICGPKILVRVGSHTTPLDSLVLAADGRGSQLIGGGGAALVGGSEMSNMIVLVVYVLH